ncbi:MAG: hypothetical protein ACFHWZ_07895 [Phycisphaerales bacterium]
MTTAAAQTDLRALLALGQARRPWEFIRAVAEAGPGIAGVPPIRFLLAANLGSLGFADLAIEEVDAVDASGTPGLNTADLRSGLASRPRTAVPVQTLRETAEHNLALLGLNRTCADTPPVWMTDTGACAWRDGVVITGCDASAHAAAVLKRSNLATDRVPSDHLPPLLIAGLSTPHLLHSALDATRPLTNGYTPRVFIVEPDEQRATRALSMLRLDENLEGDPVSERLSLFVGEGAIGSLGEALGSTIDCSLPRSVMLDGLAPKSLAESVQQVLGDLHERQREAIDHYAARIERETQTLDGAVARVRNGEQLRVLIPVSRHSNFVRHSASDLAEALRSLGHQPTILTEPEPHRVLSRLGYLRAWAETNPDLVLTINHPRWRTSSALPERAVSVCWVQDAMPHLFEDAASKQGEHDFIVGYRFHELTERFSYRADRVIDAVLPVSTTKFHGGPVDDALRERFACDVAFATRQSETPEAMRDRLRAESGASPGMGAVIDHLDETLRGRIGAGAFSFTLKESHELARSAAAPDTPRQTTKLSTRSTASCSCRSPTASSGTSSRIGPHRSASVAAGRSRSTAAAGRTTPHSPVTPGANSSTAKNSAPRTGAPACTCTPALTRSSINAVSSACSQGGVSSPIAARATHRSSAGTRSARCCEPARPTGSTMTARTPTPSTVTPNSATTSAR